MKLVAGHSKELKEINRLHEDILDHARTSVDKAIRVGELLFQVKSSLKHGKWLPWAEANLGFSIHTACRYLKCFQKRNELKSSNVLNLAAAYKLLGASENSVHVSNNSGQNEWYTPPEFVEAARAAMGGIIDLDPASCKQANKTVGARNFYSSEDNGLEQPWTGNVWLNPPYSKELIPKFADAVVQKLHNGEFKQACVLVNNATETEWFQNLLKASSAVCFLKTRIKFLDESGKPANSPLQGQAVLYFGDNKAKFAESFSETGVVLQRM